MDFGSIANRPPSPFATRIGAAPAPAAAAPAFQNVGHTGTWNGMNRAQWRDAWQGLGRVKAGDADAWLRAHGAQLVPGKNKGDKWMTPFGETYDLQVARGAANKGMNDGMITTSFNGIGPGSVGGGPRAMPPQSNSIWSRLAGSMGGGFLPPPVPPPDRMQAQVQPYQPSNVYRGPQDAMPPTPTYGGYNPASGQAQTLTPEQADQRALRSQLGVANYGGGY